MKRYLLIPLLLLCACDTFTSPGRRIERAEQELAAGNYGAAAVELRTVVDKEPTNARAQVAIAELSLQTGDVEGAGRAIDIAARGGGDVQKLSVLKAKRALLSGQYEALLAQIDSGESQLAEPQLSLYRAHALQGLLRTAEAIASFQSIAALAPEPERTEARIGLAEAYAVQGRRARALRTLDEVVADNDKSALGWFARGLLLQQMNKGQAVEESWQRALTLAPGQLTAMQRVALLTTLGQTQITSGDLAAARGFHEGLLQVSPQGIPTQLFGARLKLASGDAVGAATDMQRLLGNAPGLVAARNLLIGALLAQGNLEQANQRIGEQDTRAAQPAQPGAGDTTAIPAVQQAIKIAMQSARDSEPYLMAVANAQLALGLPEAARATVLKLLTTKPDSLAAGQAIVRLEHGTGRDTQALAAARKLKEAHPTDAGAAALLGDMLTSLRQYPEAAATYEEAWGRQQTAAVAASLYRARSLGGLPNANQPLEQWLATHPRDLVVRTLLAEALTRDGQPAQAIREYERVLGEAPRNVVALNNLALLYHDRADPRGEALARKAYELAPRVPVVADTYGWLLLGAGKRDQALKLLESAATAAPEQPEIAYHYAAALAAGQDRARAKQLLEEALANPDNFAGRETAKALLEKL